MGPGSGQAETAETRGTLFLAGAPLGRPEDASSRLRTAIAETDIIAAEDTRRLRRLAHDLGVTPAGRVVSYYDANEQRRAKELLDELLDGRDVLVITDAGMPAVSDPGHRLVSAAAEAAVRVRVLPGPSAVTAGLAVSGLPCHRFCFEGFPPRKTGQRDVWLRELAAEPRTMVFFEAPHRLAATLSAMATAFGEQRRAVACRELTKTYEEVRRGTLAELAEWASAGVRGEITVVIAGAPATPPAATSSELADEVAGRERAGIDRKAAIAEVAREYRRPKREVYDAVVQHR